MKKKNGFSLVELLIVIALMAIMAVVMVGILDPAAFVDKAQDAQRKKDLNRIKTAFEEYFNDKGSYPTDVDTWNKKPNCGSGTIFTPYLSPWPCDPDGNPYMIIVETNKFKVLTNLKNKKDDDIPTGWYSRTDLVLNGLTTNQVNYGVSSSNILWYDTSSIDSDCDTTNCLSNSTGQCKSIDFSHKCSGDYCYYYDNSDRGSCTSKCKAYCCGNGCN